MSAPLCHLPGCLEKRQDKAGSGLGPGVGPVIFNQHLIDCCLFDWSQTLLLCAFVCSLARTPPTHTHTLTASLASSLGEGPPVVFALVWWGTVDVNTVNSSCSDSSAWRGRVQEADPPKTPWGDLPLSI
ncbi:hypothetical protein HJG60_010981 [Phyllostomus discolor]|uniref:Uncharacterized protein n=1 Tax=Phyllostomus discolor TaxID=89673 RepID=A0A834ADX9_9CHIR|nr:hypothetical protein HJG60_010981 [Phyllostomus discolor]